MAQLRPGELLEERYRILQVLRAEGEGAVYLAEDTTGELGQVAITEVVDTLPSHAWRLAVESTFQTAIPALRPVQHPALVQVFDVFNVGRRHYLVAEYVPGELLQTVLDAMPGQPPFPPAQVLDWAISLCSALQHLHSQTPPIILRDVSPISILVTEDGALKLADFGFARMFLTSNVQTLAAPGYAPPEHYAGTPQPPNAQSDIYALGATLHYLLTGRDPSRLPFVFPGVTELNPAVPPALAAVVARAVALEPATRYASADTMVADLRAAKLQAQAPQPQFPAPAPATPVPAPAPPPLHPLRLPAAQDRPRRQPGGAALLAVLAVLALGLVAVMGVAGGGLSFLTGGPPAVSPTGPVPSPTATRGVVPIASPVVVDTATPPPVPVVPTPSEAPATPTFVAPGETPTAPGETPTAPPARPTDTAAPATPTPASAPATPAVDRFGVVLENAVNVRSAPGFSAGVLGQANRGDVFPLFETRQAESRTWYRIPWANQDGWMVNTFLRVFLSRAEAEAAAAPLRATPTPTATPGR